MLREPPKPRRVSKLSIQQLIPNIRSASDESQTSERSHERVSVKYPRGRPPMLHLRLSEFDVNPGMRALRSPASPSSPHICLIHETTPTRPAVEEVDEGYLEPQSPYHRNAPSDVPTSPTTPNSARTVTGPTPRVVFSSDRTATPQSSTLKQDEHLHHPTHTRGDTMSSTLSNLQAELVTLSESPPDPGFVLPIPSRSRSRQNLDLVPANRLTLGSVYSTQTTVRDAYPCHRYKQC